MTAPAPKLVGPPLLNPIRAAAMRLGISEQHVRNLLAERKLRGVRVGRRLLVPEHELERFVARAEEAQL
jgi:excisionase family DNA binding protein